MPGKGLIITYVLTYGGAAASLFDPFAGLLIYVAFAIIKPDAAWAYSVPQGRYSLIVALALLAGWAARGFGSWSFGCAKGVMVALIGFWAWMALAAAVAPNQKVAWAYVESLSKTLLPCLVAMTLIDSLGKLKALAWVIVISLGYLGVEFHQQYYSGWFNPDEWYFGGQDNNYIALFMVIGVGMAFFLGLEAEPYWQKLTAFVLAGLMAHVVLFSMSRGGMIALGLTGFVSFLLIPKRPQHYAAFFVALALVARMAGPPVLKEFGTVFADNESRDGSAASRIDHWYACIHAMQDKPLTGIGPGHFQLFARNLGFVEMKAAHTTWLLYGAELGAPAMVLVITFYGLCMARLWPYARGTTPVHDPWYPALARMTIASLVGFIVAAQFLPGTTIEAPFYLNLIGAGALKVLSAQEHVDADGGPA
jgi:O-antigen ligase